MVINHLLTGMILQVGHSKRKLVFQPSIFRCELLVSGRLIEFIIRIEDTFWCPKDPAVVFFPTHITRNVCFLFPLHLHQNLGLEFQEKQTKESTSRMSRFVMT